jgi:hypothetical protein
VKRRRRPTASIPTPADRQAEQRERRRQGYPVAYLAGFDLSAEVSDICTPLAEQVAEQPFPLACREEVVDLVEAVHTLTSSVVGWLAARDAQQRVGHLTGTDQRRAVAALVDLTPRPRLLDVTDDMLMRARWASGLVAQVQTYSEPFADYLGKALPPGHVALISRDTPQRVGTAGLRPARPRPRDRPGVLQRRTRPGAQP